MKNKYLMFMALICTVLFWYFLLFEPEHINLILITIWLFLMTVIQVIIIIILIKE